MNGKCACGEKCQTGKVHSGFIQRHTKTSNIENALKLKIAEALRHGKEKRWQGK